uniref:Uncharacterized protein n=1 Tax=Anopheles dirus TaxID=7168 RepID=A0A182NXK3_9DIPT
MSRKQGFRIAAQLQNATT